jgi:polyhydroxybutyrate depolymerase
VRIGLACVAACVVLSALVGLPSHAAAARPLRPGEREIAIRFDGRDRSYRVFVPTSAMRLRHVAVVVNFHGGGSNDVGEERFSQMDRAAARDGFVVVYPNGTGVLRGSLLTWNAGTCCGYAHTHEVDDVGFTLAVLDDLARRLPVNTREIFATGMSNGAMMAHRLAAEASERIAAIAPVAGGLVTTSFHPSRAVPVLEFHSIDDPRALFYGGLGPPFPGTDNRVLHPSIPKIVAQWASFDGCPSRPHVSATISAGGRSATQLRYAPCRAGAEVILWRLTGAGHVWPGGQQNTSPWARRLLGPPTAIIDANELMWHFFERHPLPAR